MRTLLLALALPTAAVAQPRELAPLPRPSFPGEAMIESYFRGQAKQIADKCLTDLTTKADWEKRRPELRRQFLDMMGLWPLPARTALKPTVTGTVEGDGYTVEKLHFQSMPGQYVTANLYLPKSDKPLKKLPTVLYACGHGNVVENNVSYGSKVFYQYHPAWFARNGYACLILDTLQLGEIPGEHHGTYKLGQWWWQTLGYTPGGVELWNAIRAIDYLETRPEVDAKKIGVTGRSGGGATSWWLVAADDRPACYAPVAGIVDLQSHLCEGGVGQRLKKGVIAGHCDCMFPVNTYRWDFPMVAALAAPRPVLLGNSDADEIFPIAGYRRLASKVEKVYALYGPQADNFQLLETAGPHTDTPELRHGVNRWMNRWLKGQPDLPIDDALPAKLAPQQLKVFAKLPEDAINATIQETFVKSAVIELPKSAEVAKAWWPQKRAELMRRLGTEVFAGWPRDAKKAELVDQGKTTFESESNVILTVGDRASLGSSVPDAIELYVKGPDPLPAKLLSTFWFAPRGYPPTQWARAGSSTEWAELGSSTDTHIRRRFALIGQSLDGQRVWDLRRAIQTFRTMYPPKLPVRLHAKGDAAGIALYASLFENVDELVLEDLPTSHRDGPILLNVARVLDMPQAVALAASKVRSVQLTVKAEADKAAWAWPLELQRLTGGTSLRVTVAGK